MENNNIENKNEVKQESNQNKNSNEVSSGKGLAILSYIGILCLIPYFSEKNNSFVVYHANQGLNLFLLEIIGIFGCSIIGRVLRFGNLLSSLIELAAFVLSIIGIVYVCQGEKKELPIINSLKIVK